MSYPYFTLSKKSSYAVRALFELALQGPDEPLNVRLLAGSQGLPVRFLEIILNELKQGGFVQSIRGKAGGYLLAHAADAMTVGQVLRFLDKRAEAASPSFEQPHPGEFIFRGLMDAVNEQVSDIVDNMTLDQMVRDYKTSQEAYASNYVI